MSVHPDSAFIVLEGIDGSGTTTQAHLLGEELMRRCGSQEVLVTREPYDAAVTRRIREWLKEDDPPYEALLMAFVLDRHIHLREVVKPALERGAIVVCDRYKLSTLVYQPKHNGQSLVQQLCGSAIDPDLYILLDIDADLAAARMASRSSTRDAYERNVDFQRELAADYRTVLKDEEDLADVGTALIEVGQLSILQVHEKVVEAVCEQLDIETK